MSVEPSPDPAETLQGLVGRLERHGDSAAIVTVGPSEVTVLSHARLAASARRVAADVHASGLEPGEPVAICAPNSAGWVATLLGILASGAPAMPMDARLNPGERDELIAAAGGRLFPVSDPRADDAAPGQGGLERSETPAGTHRALPTDVALLLHTSGTTGPPKVVPLTHANVLANLRALVAEGMVDRHVCALLPLPLHHVYPLVVGMLLPLYVGGTVVFPAGISGPELLRALKISGADTLVGVPRLYDGLCAAIVANARSRGPLVRVAFERALAMSVACARRGSYGLGRRAFGSLRRAVAPSLHRLACGGAALEPTTQETLLALGYEVIVGYGLTETSPLLAFTRPGPMRIGSVGRALPGIELRITAIDADGLGEIEARGPNVFTGYRGDTAATSAAFRDGWFRTGDRGRIDADGQLFVRGRASELVVLPGGEKLDPETLEASYATGPPIGEIAVLLEGGRLVALVVPSGPGEVRSALRERGNQLPRYMQLTGFALVDEPLPRTPIGKLRRHRLPALYRAARDRLDHSTQEAAPADRALLADPAASRVWTWLQGRFPQKPLSMDMSPQLDLGVDSLGWIALTVDLERDLGISLDEAALERAVTVRDLILAAQAAAPETVSILASAALEHEALWEHIVWSVGQAANRALMRLFFHVRTDGLEHLPKRGPYVLCPNHASYLDPPSLAAALPAAILDRVAWAGSVDVMFTTPGSRLFSRLARVLPIDPVRGARAGLDTSQRVLQQGRILVWFPEGWRTTDGSLRPFLPGIGALVLRMGVPIVPVYISGTFAAWPEQRRYPRPHRVVVRFGNPLAPARWEPLRADRDAAAQIAAQVKAAVAALGDSPP